MGQLPSVGQPFAIINIECHQAGSSGQGLGKLIETYRAIDTGSEIKLLLGNGSPLNDVILDKATWSVRSTVGQQQQQPQQQQQQQPQKQQPQLQVQQPLVKLLSPPQQVAAKPITKVIPSPPTAALPAAKLVTVANAKLLTVPKSKMSSECSVCGKSITTKNMARHMEKHTGKRKFECSFCSASFTQKMHLKNHVILHVTKVDAAMPSPTAATSQNASSEKTSSSLHPVKSYTCPTCKRSFVQKGHLNRHIKTAHGIDALISSRASSANSASAAEQLTCRICDKQCKNKVSLIRHRTKHLACVQCSAIFQNKVALQDHLLKVHPATAIVSVERHFAAPTLDDAADPQTEFLDPVMSVKSPSATTFDKIKVDVDEIATNVGETLADIADTNFFDSAEDLSDEFYSPDLF